MKTLLLISCMLVGLAGISVAQTNPANDATVKTEKSGTVKGKHKAHHGKHKSWSHHKGNKQVKS